MKVLKVKQLKITKNCENMPHLEISEVVLVHWNISYNEYQQNSIVLCTSILNETFYQLLDILPKNFIFLKNI